MTTTRFIHPQYFVLKFMRILAPIFFSGLILINVAHAQDEELPVARKNLKTKTLGGKQFWTDVRHFRDWRIQQHAISGHCRLISDTGTRHSWGNLAHCTESLARICEQRELEPRNGRFVVLLHGLSRSRSAMNPIAKHLKEHTDAHVVNFSYASTRASLADHANALRLVIANLEEAEEICFVGHSMGSIVVRRFLQEITDPKTGELSDSRITRMVMIGPPNNGAEIARKFERLSAFKLIFGKSALELTLKPEELATLLATPPFEFGIIVGNGGRLNNPLLDGVNDLVVSVEEAKLPGAIDFHEVEGMHTLLVNRKDVHEATLNFIEHGWFRSADDRKPVEPTSKEADQEKIELNKVELSEAELKEVDSSEVESSEDELTASELIGSELDNGEAKVVEPQLPEQERSEESD